MDVLVSRLGGDPVSALKSAADMPELVEAACRASHDAYEVAAAAAGWETNRRSRVSWDEVPDENKVAMRAGTAAALSVVPAPLALPEPTDTGGEFAGPLWIRPGSIVEMARVGQIYVSTSRRHLTTDEAEQLALSVLAAVRIAREASR